MRLAIVFLFGIVCLSPAWAGAQDRIRLHEVLGALEGTELGNLDVGPAPPPGGVSVVRRSHILAALRRAGRSTDGLAIPRTSRIRRSARTISPPQMVRLGTPAARSALAPCQLTRLYVSSPARVGTGELDVSAQVNRPNRSGRVPLVLIVAVGGRSTRVPAAAEVQCPAPVVRPGQRVQIVARFGAVRATVPGQARQPGRVGDVIRVQSLQSRTALRARVLSAQAVEVVQ